MAQDEANLPQSLPESLLTEFFKLSIVNIASNLMVPFAGLLDVAFLGHLSEIRHLAGVALATVIFNYLYWSFGFLRMGTTGLTAQAIGRDDRAGMHLIGLRHGLVALLLGLGILLVQVPVREVGFALLNASPEVKLAGEAYFNAMIWGAPATLLNYVLIGWFLGRAEGKVVLALSIVGNLSKVLLDYGLIVLLGWESAGAGAATALSQSLMGLTGLGIVLWHRERSTIGSLWGQVWDPKAIGAMFSLNGAILVRTFALLSAFALFTKFSAALGITILTANTLLLEVLSLSAYFVDGFAYATESFVGQLWGQGQKADLVKVLRISGGASLGFGLLFAIGFAGMPQPLFRLLTDHREVVETAAQFAGWLVPVLGFGSIAYMLDGYFLGLAQGQVLRNSSIVATGVGFLPIGLLGWHWHNPHLLWLSMAGFMLTRVITLAIQVPSTLRD